MKDEERRTKSDMEAAEQRERGKEKTYSGGETGREAGWENRGGGRTEDSEGEQSGRRLTASVKKNETRESR